MQQRVYQTKVQNVNDLKRRLINVRADMQQSVIDDAIDQWRKRLHACVRASLSMHCDSRTILINAANYCYHLVVKIYCLTRHLFQTNASFWH